MNFKPKSDEQLKAEAEARAAARLLPVGDYPFETTKSAEETSKAGNPMIHVEVTIVHNDQRIALDDYLMAQMEFKLKHYCATTGMLDLYQQGTLHALDCEGKSGWVRVGIEKGRPKTNGHGNFADKNKVVDYVPAPVKIGDSRPQPTEAQMANVSTDPLIEDAPF